MSEIFNPNYNDMPTQVEVNKRDIEDLKNLVKKAYTTTQDYGEQQGYPILSVPLTTTDLPQDSEVGVFSGFMLTRDGILTNIINIDYEYIEEVQTKIVNASYVCSLRGEKGDTGSVGPVGPVGPQGPAGDPGDQIYVAEYVAPTPSGVGVIANIPWSATSVPVDIQNVPDSIILVGNGWFYHIDGYTSSSDPTGYDLICSSVADVRGPAGQNGTDGQDGVTPNITMSATVNDTTGTPTVTVTKTGTTTNPLFSLTFENLKGAQGPKGDDAVTLSIGTVTEGSPADASLTSDGNGNYTLDLTIPSGSGGGSDPDALKIKFGSNFSFTNCNNSQAFNGFNFGPISTMYASMPTWDPIANLYSSMVNAGYEYFTADDFDASNLWCDGHNLYYFDYYINNNTNAVERRYWIMQDDYTWRQIDTYVDMQNVLLRGSYIFDIGNANFVYCNTETIDDMNNLQMMPRYYWIKPVYAFNNGSLVQPVPSIKPCYTDSNEGVEIGDIDTVRDIFKLNNINYYIKTISGTTTIRKLYLDTTSVSGQATLHATVVSIFSNKADYKPNLIIANKSAYLVEYTGEDEPANFNKISNQSGYPANLVNTFVYDATLGEILPCEVYHYSSPQRRFISEYMNINNHLFVVLKLIGYNGETAINYQTRLYELLDDENGNILFYPATFLVPDYEQNEHDFEEWSTNIPQSINYDPCMFKFRGKTYLQYYYQGNPCLIEVYNAIDNITDTR